MRSIVGLMLVDRAGNAREIAGERRPCATVTVSPRGNRLAATIFAANDSLRILDLEWGSSSRVTFEAEKHSPVWAPDAGRLVFTRFRGGEPHRLFVMPSDGSTAPELLRTADRWEGIPASWNTATNTGGGANPRWRADGREIYFNRGDAVLAADVTLAPSFGVSVPHVLFRFGNDLRADFSWDVSAFRARSAPESCRR